MKNLQGKKAKQPPQFNSALPTLSSPRHATNTSHSPEDGRHRPTLTSCPALCSTWHHTPCLIMASGYTLHHVLPCTGHVGAFIEDILGLGAQPCDSNLRARTKMYISLIPNQDIILTA